jgi:hypothetical protein
MQSTLTLQETDPHDSFVIEPDVVLAARADHTDQASPDPVHEALTWLSQRRAETAPDTSAEASTPAVDTNFRAASGDTIKVPEDRITVSGEPSSFSRWAMRASVAFLFALGSAVAAEAWKHHGDTATQMISNWLPPFALASSSPAVTPPLAGQPASSPVRAASADQAPAQPAASAPPVEGAAPAASASPTDPTPLLQSMARDLASMGQQVEQLKASIEQIKSAQAQMARDTAKVSEQNLRPKIAALPPRPVAPPPRRPKPAYAPAAVASTLQPPPYQQPYPAQQPYAVPPPPYPAPPPQPALSQPVPPPQATVQQDGDPVVRPPMPLR